MGCAVFINWLQSDISRADITDSGEELTCWRKNVMFAVLGSFSYYLAGYDSPLILPVSGGVPHLESSQRSFLDAHGSD